MSEGTQTIVLNTMTIMDLIFGSNANEGQARVLAKTFLKGVVYANLAIILSLLVFKQLSSFLMIIFTSFFAIPLIYSKLKREEKEVIQSIKELPLFKHHTQLFIMFLALFIGVGFVFTGWYLLAPAATQEALFSTQSDILTSINLVSGRIVNTGEFLTILTHNLKVFFVSFILSFMFGYGALFILTWNAALISVAVGKKVLSLSSTVLSATGLQALVITSTGYMLHGIPEFSAYIIAGVMGSIVSIAIVSKETDVNAWGKIIKDSAFMFVVATGLLVLGALIEVHISPLLL